MTGESRILRAQGEGQAILTVFQSIHDGSPDQALLAYQYLQMLPKIAEGDANKVWIVPSEIGEALEGPRQRVRVDPGHPARHQWSQASGSTTATPVDAGRRQKREDAALASARRRGGRGHRCRGGGRPARPRLERHTAGRYDAGSAG